MIPDDEQANYEVFRDCLGDGVIQTLSPSATVTNTKRSKSSKHGHRRVSTKDAGKTAFAKPGISSDAAELGDFIEYLASEIFMSLPPELRTLSYSSIQNNPKLADVYSLPLSTPATDTILNTLPPSATDSLTLYLSTDAGTFLPKPLESYISSVTAPPPIYSTTRTTECELCLRDWIPLTYHHLIPRSVHAKAMKRNWAEEWELNKVAWLCRACHSYVHHVCTHEELAKEFDSVEKLAEREDVSAFVGWVGRVRWKSR